jgi:DNA-binding CsgD family transcriptional regulator
MHRSGTRAPPKRAQAPRLAPPVGLSGTFVRIGDEELAVLSVPVAMPSWPRALTPAELEVTRLLFEGRSNAEIADARGTAQRTVANQIARIFEKLGVSSRAELLASLLRSPAP